MDGVFSWLYTDLAALYYRSIEVEALFKQELDGLSSHEYGHILQLLQKVQRYFERNDDDYEALVGLGTTFVLVHCGTTVTEETGKPRRPKKLMLYLREILVMRVVAMLGYLALNSKEYERRFEEKAYRSFGVAVQGMHWDTYRELLALLKQAYFKVYRALSELNACMQSRSSSARKRAPRKSRGALPDSSTE